jgi:DNA-binding response OmpR family regulator
MTKVNKVLIAEDEKPMANALELKLNKSGFQAKAVFDGSSAIDILSKEQYDLLLLDLMMPKMDGFEVIQKLKELKINVPVIVLSNLSQEEDKKKALAIGAKDYFVKSDTPITDIVKKVSEFLK